MKIDTVMLEATKVAARSQMPEQYVHLLDDQTKILEYRIEHLRATAMELQRYVYQQTLPSEYIDLDFTRKVDSPQRTLHHLRILNTRVDALLYLLPKWLRWRKISYRFVYAKHTLSPVKVPVTVKETVQIERKLSYPDYSPALPENQMGRPVFVARFVRD